MILNEKNQDKAKQIFQRSKVTITTEEHRLLEGSKGRLMEAKHSKKVT